MTYREGSFSGAAGNAAEVFIGVLEQDLLLNSWTKVDANVVSGSCTWNVYRSDPAQNGLGRAFHVAFGYPTATKSTFIFCIFRDWDTLTKRASGIPPLRGDSIEITSFLGYEAVQPPQPLPDINNLAGSRFEFFDGPGLYGPANDRRASFISGTGTNGVNPPVINNAAMSFTGIENGVPDMGIGIDSLTIVAGGSGYTSPPTMTISGGGASVDAAGTVQVSGGIVTGVTMTNYGFGYTSQPTITLTGGGGTGAQLQARGVWNTASNWRAIVRGFTPGKWPTDYTGKTNSTQLQLSSGTHNGTPPTYRWVPVPNFMHRSCSLGTAGVDYWFSVTPEKIIYGLRTGVTINDAYYIGVYDSFLTSIDDPLPVCAVYLTSQFSGMGGNAPTLVYQSSAYGWAITEPRVVSLDPKHWMCNVPSYQFMQSQSSWYGSRCLLSPLFGGGGTNVREGYTGKSPVVKAVLMGRGSWGVGYGDSPWLRGTLRGVYASNANAWANSWGDEISWVEAGTLKYGTRAGQWIWVEKA